MNIPSYLSLPLIPLFLPISSLHVNARCGKNSISGKTITFSSHHYNLSLNSSGTQLLLEVKYVSKMSSLSSGEANVCIFLHSTFMSRAWYFYHRHLRKHSGKKNWENRVVCGLVWHWVWSREKFPYMYMHIHMQTHMHRERCYTPSEISYLTK